MNLVSVSAALGGISAAGGVATVNITNTVEAGVNASMLTANDEVNVDSDSLHYAKPDVGGFSFSTGIAASAVKAVGTVAGATRAYLSGASTISSAGAVDVTADSDAYANPHGIALGGGLLAGIGVTDFTATVNRETAAYVGSRAGTTPVAAVINVGASGNQALNVRADANLNATADSTALGFSLAVGATDSKTTAIVEGRTFAYVGEGATVNAGDVDIRATSLDTALADNFSAEFGGLATVGFSTADATVSSRTEAFAGALSMSLADPAVGVVATNIATAINAAATPTKVMGSFASIPTSELARSFVAQYAPAAPTATPTRTGRIPCHVMSRSTSLPLAPSAMRTPISCVRSDTK